MQSQGGSTAKIVPSVVYYVFMFPSFSFFFFSNYFMVSWTEFNMVLTACPSNLIQQLRIDL